MTDTQAKWQPKYSITPSIARNLMDIEAARVVVDSTPLPPAVQAELTRRARSVLLIIPLALKATDLLCKKRKK